MIKLLISIINQQPEKYKSEQLADKERTHSEHDTC